MSTFHPATSSLARFQEYNIDDLYDSILRLHQLFSSRQEPTFVMASQLKLFLPANYTTHLLSSTHATNEGIAVLKVWSIFPFAIKCILGIKRIFLCSFENKRMRLLTHVYGSPILNGTWQHWPEMEKLSRRSFRKPNIVPSHITTCGLSPQMGHWKLDFMSILSNLAKAFHAWRSCLIGAGGVKLWATKERLHARR